MIFAAIILMTVGLVASVLGLKLFRILLPIVGFITGVLIGFTGFQGIFGTGTVSTTVAVFVAVTVGVVLAILSYAFFAIAVVVLAGVIGASVFSYLGIALGLGKNGFLLFMLSVAGFIIGLIVSSNRSMGVGLVMVLTSMIGVAFILSGIFLVAGSVTLQELQTSGVVHSVLRVVDQSLLWLFVWLGGSIIATQIQGRMAVLELVGNNYEYQASVNGKN